MFINNKFYPFDPIMRYIMNIGFNTLQKVYSEYYAQGFRAISGEMLNLLDLDTYKIVNDEKDFQYYLLCRGVVHYIFARNEKEANKNAMFFLKTIGNRNTITVHENEVTNTRLVTTYVVVEDESINTNQQFRHHNVWELLVNTTVKTKMDIIIDNIITEIINEKEI